MALIHCVNPNGGHLRACGELAQPQDYQVQNFIGMMVYGLSYDLCPDCVDTLEQAICSWRRLSGRKYRGLVARYEEGKVRMTCPKSRGGCGRRTTRFRREEYCEDCMKKRLREKEVES